MIAVDTNLLVYAHRVDSPWHERAEPLLRELAEGSAPWAIPWPCIHEFAAIVTQPRIYKPPTPLERAIEQVEAWLESPSLVLLSESSMHWEALKRQLLVGKISGGAVHDARVAALCADYRVTALWSCDRDFTRFPDVRVVNPLTK